MQVVAYLLISTVLLVAQQVQLNDVLSVFGQLELHALSADHNVKGVLVLKLDVTHPIDIAPAFPPADLVLILYVFNHDSLEWPHLRVWSVLTLQETLYSQEPRYPLDFVDTVPRVVAYLVQTLSHHLYTTRRVLLAPYQTFRQFHVFMDDFALLLLLRLDICVLDHSLPLFVDHLLRLYHELPFAHLSPLLHQ